MEHPNRDQELEKFVEMAFWLGVKIFFFGPVGVWMMVQNEPRKYQTKEPKVLMKEGILILTLPLFFLALLYFFPQIGQMKLLSFFKWTIRLDPIAKWIIGNLIGGALLHAVFPLWSALALKKTEEKDELF